MKVEIEINSCRECKHFKDGGRQSTDGWDEGYDWFCSKMDNKKIAGFVEWHENPSIPTWCPIAPPKEPAKPLTKMERLQIWAAGLTEENAKSILVVLVERMVETEEICFYDDTVAPYWDSCGEAIDGIEREA